MTARSAAEAAGGVNRPLTALAGALALATGVIHAWIGLDYLMAGLQQSALTFLAMATPYFAGVALYVLGFAKRWIVRLGLLYVALLMVLWLLLGARDVLAYVDKLIELVLFVVLGILVYTNYRRERSND